MAGYTINREELRGKLRIMLEDTDETTPKWSDAALNQFIGDAIELHTAEVPYSASGTITANGSTYDYPERAVSIYRVYGQFGQGVEEFVDKAPRDIFVGVWESGDEPVCLIPNFPASGQYYLPKAPVADFTLYYGVYLADPGDDETDVDFGTRAWAPRAVCRLAGALAFDPKSASRANLEQWAGEIDLRVDNPLEQEAKRWYALYEELILRFGQALSIARS